MFVEKRLIKTEDIVDNAITRSKTSLLSVLWVKTASPTPGVNGAYGTAVTLAPSPNKSVILLSILMSWGGTFATGETVTIRITVTFSDNTTASITRSSSSTGTISLNPSDLQSLFKDGVYITQISVDSSSTTTTTSVTTSVTIYGFEI